jgi:osmoprotectant transport system substrate-binding protein
VRSRRFPLGAAAVALVCILGSAACRSGTPATTSALGDGKITVGSFNFPENVLIGELYAQALEASHFQVVRELDIGTRELVDPALQGGLLEVVPEYAGSALVFLGGTAVADPSITLDRLRSAATSRGLTALDAAPAMDRNGFAMTAARSRSLGIEKLSDLRSRPGTLLFGGPPECPQRPLCLQGLTDRYGLKFARFVPLDAGGPLTVRGLNDGEIDVGLIFTSDPSFDTQGFVLLRDDLGLEPAENITPLVRNDTLARFGPTLSDTLNAVSTLLTTEALRAVNLAVSNGQPVGQVARDWLASQGLGP